MTAKFDRAFELLIGHEGGYVNHPDDPGGETKFGISKRSYPNVDIAALTLDAAKAIYLRDFWTPLRAEVVPEPIALVMFDFAVNSGVQQAIMSLQRSLAVKVDGDFGPRTQEAVARRSVRSMVIDYQAERIVFMASLKTFSTFGRGWSRRVIAMAVDSIAKET